MRYSTLPLALILVRSVFAAETPPSTAALSAANTRVFAYTAAGLSGPGADFLREETAACQFVLFGEDHMDHAVPIFAGGLYAMLHATHGFHHLVVEQDPVAIADALAPARRGDADQIAAHAKACPGLYEFDSDEDLTLLAQVGRLEDNADAIWGVEQATGVGRYLEELRNLAPDDTARGKIDTLRAAALAADPGPAYSVNWLANTATPAALADLAAVWPAAPGSRAAELQDALAKSAEIFGYYTRAEAGEYVGLYNNTVREEVLKRNFLRRYRAAEMGDPLPKAMFKFGANHLYHGKNPTQAFPIGNLAHELAIANGSRAYGIMVQPLGPGYVKYQDLPAWMLSFLPPAEPTEPIVVDLRSLRRFQRLFRETVKAGIEAESQRTLLHGYDALVLLPGSKPSVKKLGGRGVKG